MECVAQVVEHVIAAPVDHARFENRVIESGVAHDLFCFPFRFAVRRAAKSGRARRKLINTIFSTPAAFAASTTSRVPSM